MGHDTRHEPIWQSLLWCKHPGPWQEGQAGTEGQADATCWDGSWLMFAAACASFVQLGGGPSALSGWCFKQWLLLCYCCIEQMQRLLQTVFIRCSGPGYCKISHNTTAGFSSNLKDQPCHLGRSSLIPRIYSIDGMERQHDAVQSPCTWLCSCSSTAAWRSADVHKVLSVATLKLCAVGQLSAS